MKFWLFTFFERENLEKKIKDYGEISKEDPEFIFTYGGDGTLLQAERRYPGVPKIFLKKDGKCEKYTDFLPKDLDSIIDSLKKGNYQTQTYHKVEAEYKDKTLLGLNEVQINNKDPRKALRFSLTGNGLDLKEIIGDGVIAATAFGSTAYYRAMGYQPFEEGIRIALNNSFPRIEPRPLKEAARINIIRENGYLTADNGELLDVGPGDEIEFRPSEEEARLVTNPKL